MQAQVDREKVMIEAIVARIEAEDAATADLKRQRQAQLSQSLQDQQRQRAALHLEARQAEATEEKRCLRRILAFGLTCTKLHTDNAACRTHQAFVIPIILLFPSI